MRVLVLGATGMLGHKLWQTLSERHEAWAAVRCDAPQAQGFGLFDPARLVCGVDARRAERLEAALEAAAPQVVVNCAGVIKQALYAGQARTGPVELIELNALLPHRLAEMCAARGARLIHISTDCVFDGARGLYAEADRPCPPDLYGRSKLLGEVEENGALTLRTSLVGRELRGGASLLEWFLSASAGPDPVRGYSRAIFSGFSTLEFSRLLARIIEERPDLHGLWHASAEPISKFELLGLFARAYGRSTALIPDGSLMLDRSLDSSRLRAELGYAPPAWPDMVRAMAQDPTPYPTSPRRDP